MKTNLSIIAFLFCSYCSTTTAQDFSVEASIPGLRAGTEVELRSADGHGRTISQIMTTDANSFTLTGQIDKPTLVELRIDDKPKAEYAEKEMAHDRGTKFMLEPGTTTIRSQHLDSIPFNYIFRGTPLLQEFNIEIDGTRSQREYNEWRRYIHDADLKLWEAGFAMGDREFDYFDKKLPKATDEEMHKLKAAVAAEQEALEALKTTFMAQHPDYAISLLEQMTRLQSVFTFTNNEYDQILEQYAGNYDVVGYEQMKQIISANRKLVKGTHYADMPLYAPDGKATSLKELVKEGTINFIDFWASWCGPCRAAIPSVKQMYGKFGDRLNIISISVDRDEKAWQQAMETEQMPWVQAVAKRDANDVVRNFYRVMSIPSLFIIDAEGRIIKFTQSADEAHQALEAILGE